MGNDRDMQPTARDEPQHSGPLPSVSDER